MPNYLFNILFFMKNEIETTFSYIKYKKKYLFHIKIKIIIVILRQLKIINYFSLN